MAGLRGQVREPRKDPRARRNSQGLASESPFVSSGNLVIIDGEGYFDVSVAADSGLSTSGGELAVIAGDGIVVTASGIEADLADATLTVGPTGLAVDPAAVDHDQLLNFVADEHVDHSGVSVTTTAPLTGGGDLTASRVIGLGVGNGLELVADALTLSTATEAARGGVLQAAARADSVQNAVTLTASVDPTDTPATADALRDDLVANVLPTYATRDTELETAIETLAGEFNDLLAKLRTAGVINT